MYVILHATFYRFMLRFTDITVSIGILSGTNTAGEAYDLVCFAVVNGSGNQPSFIWLNPMNNSVDSQMVNATGSMSMLYFRPLVASDAGMYTCTATLGSVVQTASINVTVESKWSVISHTSMLSYLRLIPPDPSITAFVSESGVTPIVGIIYSLTCTVSLLVCFTLQTQQSLSLLMRVELFQW